ncbi:hypothetical protein NWI01_02480 [Nitrobacter winogradskyi]|uniref:Uncharacterized protein n=1 Tax=Nitrobacter winogradskyi TaxID=913 RepID=A0A4Y3WAS4_NITWI|nr:hypothetical protein NWI01_02480 [Nitrobacter winogradskyi]
MQSCGKPTDRGGTDKAETCRRGIDQKILQPRMAAGGPSLHDLENTYQDDGYRCHAQSSLGK